MSESINREAMSSYEPLDKRPASYLEIQLPPQTGQDRDYYNLDDYVNQ